MSCWRRRNKNDLKMLFLDDGRSPLNERTSVSAIIEFSGRVTEASVSEARSQYLVTKRVGVYSSQDPDMRQDDRAGKTSTSCGKKKTRHADAGGTKTTSKCCFWTTGEDHLMREQA